jgi:hypothetical protein
LELQEHSGGFSPLFNREGTVEDGHCVKFMWGGATLQLREIDSSLQDRMDLRRNPQSVALTAEFVID